MNICCPPQFLSLARSWTLRGHPIADVSLDHFLQSSYGRYRTDNAGHFNVHCNAPALVFRKAGYQSVFMSVKADANVQIKMLPTTLTFPTCSANVECTDLPGWGRGLCVPAVSGIVSGPRSIGIEADSSRGFTIEGSTASMTHGRGPTAVSTLPWTLDVWRSIKYSEINYVISDGVSITDARGTMSTGKRWRQLSGPGPLPESISYHDLDADRAALFDKLLDGVCIREQRR